MGLVTKIYYLEILRASESRLSRWSRLHLQSLVPTNPHWAGVVGYGPFSLSVINKEGLCPSSGEMNRLMIMTAYGLLFNNALPINMNNFHYVINSEITKTELLQSTMPK
jgi:hypothetical protein